MSHSSRRDKAALLLQTSRDGFVSVLDVDTLVVRHLIGELAVVVDGAWRRARVDDVLGDACLVIFLTKAWSAVHHSSSHSRSDERSCNHAEAALLSHMCEVREQRLILLAVEILALHLGDDLDLLDVALLLNLLEEAFEANVGLALFLVEEFDVLELRVHCAS